ncbi:MAG: DUF2062 domain-containing protein [Phycisphaeraceae bacterium]
MYRRHIRARWRLYARRSRQFVLHNILHADDPPHRLALGIAVGIWVMYTPTMGLQMMMVVALAWLLGANKVVGLPVIWISNPVTFVPIFWPSYWLGSVLLGEPTVREGYWRELLKPPPGWLEGVVFYWSSFMEIAAPLWLGSLIIGTIAATVTYFVCHRLICFYRIRRWGGIVPPSMALVPVAKHKASARPADKGKEAAKPHAPKQRIMPAVPTATHDPRRS